MLLPLLPFIFYRSPVTFFMLPSTPVPPGKPERFVVLIGFIFFVIDFLGYGAVLYYSVPPFSSWELLGSVSPGKQSGIFRTGWSTKEDMAGCPIVRLGVSLES